MVNGVVSLMVMFQPPLQLALGWQVDILLVPNLFSVQQAVVVAIGDAGVGADRGFLLIGQAIVVGVALAG